MAALVASRANPVIAAHYQKLRAAGKAAKQALTACIRKLHVIPNAILRDRKPWLLLDNRDSRSRLSLEVGVRLDVPRERGAVVRAATRTTVPTD